jgi:putative PEP-CTERM system histidine kinase
VIFLFGAILVLVILMLSRPVRARLRVFINEHFFHYKYDYRDEWLRLIGTLSSGQPDEHLRERAVRALAEMMESRGGLLWLQRDSGRYEPLAAWHMDIPDGAVEPEHGPLVRFLEQRQWVINLGEHAREPGMYADLELPAWIASIPDAWLITPLLWHDRLIGFILLSGAPAGAECNWEDFDLLKTAGRQIASHLAQLEVSRQLAEARQFEMCNRLSTYVLHDLKNLVSQLSLVVTNAARHKHNPQFMEDAIRTVENSVEKMNALMATCGPAGHPMPRPSRWTCVNSCARWPIPCQRDGRSRVSTARPRAFTRAATGTVSRP